MTGKHAVEPRLAISGHIAHRAVGSLPGYQEERSRQALRYPLGVRFYDELNLPPLPLGQPQVLPCKCEDRILLHARPELQLTDYLVGEPHSFRERFGIRKHSAACTSR